MRFHTPGGGQRPLVQAPIYDLRRMVFGLLNHVRRARPSTTREREHPMRLHWIPWKYLIQRAARAYGIIDPITLMARLRKFSQPSDVQEPIELLREIGRAHV